MTHIHAGRALFSTIELSLSRENAGLEVKPGRSRIERAELNLITLRDARVDTDQVGLPAFLAIITGTQYASTRPSGVHLESMLWP